MADKSNAMQQGHALWQRVFKEVAAEYPGINATHLYIDALAMFLVKDPGQFQVIVTNNLFGDIVTDIGGALQGGLGMAASGNLHPGQTSMFEPVHGSAPPLAGKNVANPDGRHPVGGADARNARLRRDEAKAIEAAVAAAVAAGQTTADIGGTLGTREVGDWIAESQRKPIASELTVRSCKPRSMTKRRLHPRRRAHADDAARRRAQGLVGHRSRRDRRRRRRSSAPASKPEWVDHVVFGNVQQSSVDAHYGARHVGLKAGLPIEVPALTVNRLCGSGIQARDQRRAADSARRGRHRARRRHGEHEPGAARHPRRCAAACKLGQGKLEDSLWEGLIDPLRRLLDGDHRRELRGEVRHHARSSDAYALRSQQLAHTGVDVGRR